MTQVEQKPLWPARWWWAALLVIIGFALGLYLLTYDFSLPYVAHPDEPNYYLAAQEARGLFDNRGYYDHAPPGYIYTAAAVQILTEPLGAQGMAAQVRLLRLLAVSLSILALVFIAMTARRIGGEWAGLMAGLTWAISPQVLLHGVYALPDPPVYFFAALAIWLAGEALACPERARWSIWSVAVGVLAVAFKAYLPLLLPGVLAALIITLREWQTGNRRGLRLLTWQALIIVLTALWVIFGIGFAPTGDLGPDNGGANTILREIRENGIGRILNLDTVLNNLRFALIPLGADLIAAVLGLGLVVFLVRRWLRKDVNDVRIDTLLMIVMYGVLAAWVIAAYNRVGLSQIRYVIPITAGACVLAGAAFGQVVALFTGRRRALAGLALLTLFSVIVGGPLLEQDRVIVADRTRPDQRTDVRFWAETTLDAAPVLVTMDNHKTFNHVWSGIPVAKWFDWIVADDVAAYPVEHWREERGLDYALLTIGDRQQLETIPEGQAFLAEMLLLRDFPERADRRGPGMTMYRLWKMQTPLNARFGPDIAMVGYDLDSPAPEAGGTLTLHFYWQAANTPAGDYSVFVHLTPENDRAPITQTDGSPARPERPTPSWNAPSETLISQPFTLEIPSNLPAGDYRVLIGLYDYTTGERLPVTPETESVSVLHDDSLHLLTLSVD